jgi:hypothetical protein
MMRLRVQVGTRLLAVTIAALVVGLAGPSAASAKVCSAGYAHAVIGGAQKCLRRGEYCSVREKRQYPRYGYICEDGGGTYRLEPI